MTLSHLDASGRARMVDVGDKDPTVRRAVAEGRIRLSDKAFAAVEGNRGPKGDVLRTAELAGTMAAKRTAELIPLCHPVALDHIEVIATLEPARPGIHVRATARTAAKTGVEMEALTAVDVALLTVWDMVKSAGQDLEIHDVRLLEKTGGTRGDWRRTEVDL